MDATVGESAAGEIGPEEIWTEPVDRLLLRLVTTAAGLDTAAVQSRLATFGPNDAATVKRSPLWLQFLARFRSPLVIILLVASALSAATGDIASFVIVISIVTASMTLDFVQEVRAQNAVEALRRSVAVQATVRRDGKSLSIPIDQLVPGDIVELIAGDLVPADSRLLESRDVFVNEVLLTILFVLVVNIFFHRSVLESLMFAMALATVAIALPLLPFGRWFGFVAPPPLFFVYLTGATILYLALVEITKGFFFRTMAGR
jgi:hypothetical protein